VPKEEKYFFFFNINMIYVIVSFNECYYGLPPVNLLQLVTIVWGEWSREKRRK
jgi:hypothetical protein